MSMRYLVTERLPPEQWHRCTACQGTGFVRMERDLHRSAGIIPCPNHHCHQGTVRSHTVDKTPEPLRSRLDACDERNRKMNEHLREQFARIFARLRRRPTE
jgi:hypothetical protein